MKAKLSKEEGWYDLYRIDEDGKRVTFASTQDFKQKLSLKNCQAIECGYDLDELAFDYEKENEEHIQIDERQKQAFKAGFQKALEILDDKKFSEDDMIMFGEYCRSDFDGLLKTKDLYSEYQSLQQTEWDVEILINNVLSFEANQIDARVNPNFGNPLLDADGCLILKRK